MFHEVCTFSQAIGEVCTKELTVLGWILGIPLALIMLGIFLIPFFLVGLGFDQLGNILDNLSGRKNPQ